MNGVHELAIRFADLWAIDHHRMVDEIYAPEIHMASMTRLDHVPVRNGAELHELEDRLAAMIPEHRHELVRVIAGDRRACLETTVVGPTTGEYAPACVWWWIDDRGQVNREIGFFDWERRSTDSRFSHGHVPADDRRPRAVDAVIDAVASGSIETVLAQGCVVEQVGAGPCSLAAIDPGPAEVQEVLADGGVVALLVAREGWRGTVVLTLDGTDHAVSLRLYANLSDRAAAS